MARKYESQSIVRVLTYKPYSNWSDRRAKRSGTRGWNGTWTWTWDRELDNLIPAPGDYIPMKTRCPEPVYRSLDGPGVHERMLLISCPCCTAKILVYAGVWWYGGQDGKSPVPGNGAVFGGRVTDQRPGRKLRKWPALPPGPCILGDIVCPSGCSFRVWCGQIIAAMSGVRLGDRW